MHETFLAVVSCDGAHYKVLFGCFWWMLEQNRTSRPPGGYNLQYGSGYRPSGPQQWGPPGAPPPYGYQQPAHYPGPPQPYPQAPPQAYGQFSQQPPGVYSSGWEQRSPASATQAQQQSSYDYYGQQNQQVRNTFLSNVMPRTFWLLSFLFCKM